MGKVEPARGRLPRPGRRLRGESTREERAATARLSGGQQPEGLRGRLPDVECWTELLRR